jgi:hypothetical protein
MDRVREELTKIMNEPRRRESAQRVEAALKQTEERVAKKHQDRQKSPSCAK